VKRVVTNDLGQNLSTLHISVCLHYYTVWKCLQSQLALLYGLVPLLIYLFITNASIYELCDRLSLLHVIHMLLLSVNNKLCVSYLQVIMSVLSIKEDENNILEQ
ncbi:hypothetical protein ACJX0J_042503, partial [Zea mays]